MDILDTLNFFLRQVSLPSGLSPSYLFKLQLIPSSLNGTFPERLIPDGIIPSLADRVPSSPHVMRTEFLPALVLFYSLAVLVQLPNTRVLRLSLLAVMGTV